MFPSRNPRRRAVVFAVAMLLTILMFSARPVPPPAAILPLWTFDKVGHFGVFGLLATAWIRTGLRPWQAVLLVVAYSVVDETVQGMNPVRVFDLRDIVANAVGAVVAAVAWCYWGAYRRLLETRVC
ncbi:MAG: VanZ family protein [Verrucomicrobiota bacterium JB022]|nr:VanZ family protein [Verrucomicrobiota bacterium JB022]